MLRFHHWAWYVTGADGAGNSGVEVKCDGRRDPGLACGPRVR